MASDTDPKTVLLRGDNAVHGEAVAAAGSNIVPGMLLETTAAGAVQPHSEEGGPAQRRFAREESYAGGSIDDVFEDGDTVPFWDMNNGDWVYAFLAAGESVEAGDLLDSNGDGSLRAHAVGAVVGKAHETVDNSGGTSAVRIRVEVL